MDRSLTITHYFQFRNDMRSSFLADRSSVRSIRITCPESVIRIGPQSIDSADLFVELLSFSEESPILIYSVIIRVCLLGSLLRPLIWKTHLRPLTTKSLKITFSCHCWNCPLYRLSMLYSRIPDISCWFTFWDSDRINWMFNIDLTSDRHIHFFGSGKSM
jgi:hypothetical protein